MGIRSFLAFDLPLEIKDIVARVSGELRKSTLDLKWVKVDNIHLTVVFLGNVRMVDLKAIGDEVQKVCLKTGSFDVSLVGMGVFPNRRNPWVLWLGLNGDLERMSHFRDALQNCLKPFGIKEEKRRFKPHLTLGRSRKSNKKNFQLDEILSEYKDLASPVCSVEELILFKSDLKPGGAVYTKLASWPLLGER